jgi:hypothetical protein
VKGWYDEQNLADASTGSVRPLNELATIVPDSTIARLTVADYSGSWHTVATTSIRKKSTTYWHKMLLGEAPLPNGAPPTNLTESALCRSGINPATGATVSCDGVPVNLAASCDWNTMPQNHPEYGWFVRVSDPQEPANVLYKCGIRHDHSGYEIPATARWMWLDRDETQWYRCDQGCCTLKP